MAGKRRALRHATIIDAAGCVKSGNREARNHRVRARIGGGGGGRLRRRHADRAAIRSGMRVTVGGHRQYFAALWAYRYRCIFKGCHVKRQARPLNTFKFINGEGYTPSLSLSLALVLLTELYDTYIYIYIYMHDAV